MTLKRCKFRAFLTLSPPLPRESPERDDVSGPAAALSSALPPGQLRRMAVRGEHHDTHGRHFFSALVTNSDEAGDWIGENHAIVTVTLTGDNPLEYFSAGDHLALWLGHDIANGVVTRRLVV
jgi:hypothetical protein